MPDDDHDLDDWAFGEEAPEITLEQMRAMGDLELRDTFTAWVYSARLFRPAVPKGFPEKGAQLDRAGMLAALERWHPEIFACDDDGNPVEVS